jgi:hypothetical protein
MAGTTRAEAMWLQAKWGRREGNNVIWGGIFSLAPDETPEAMRALVRPVGQGNWQELPCDIDGNTWTCAAEVGPNPVYVGVILYYRKAGVPGILTERRAYMYRYEHWFRL